MGFNSFKAGSGRIGFRMLFFFAVLLAALGTKSAYEIAGRSRPVHAAEITGPAILARIRPGHPRLMMGSDTIEVLKSNLQKDPWLNRRYLSLKAQAGRVLTEPACKYELSGNAGLLQTSRRVLDRVVTLALVYRIEGDKRYLDRCWAELNGAARYRDWYPSNFLCTAEMTAAFAIGYDWLYYVWTKERRQTLRQAIIRHGLKPCIKSYRPVPAHWTKKLNNWNVVCNGGLAMGALAIADESPDIAAEVLAHGLESVRPCLAQFAPDGAWFEGPAYWGYGTLYESMYLSSLETACGTDFGLGDLPGVARGGWFPVYLNSPTGRPFNFADAEEDDEPVAGPQLLWLARRFCEPRYAQYQIERQCGRVASLDMIWGPGVERKPWQTIERDRFFRGVEVATMRDGWDKAKGWFIGFKAGSNAFSHAHLDVGSFVLEANGVRWVIDLGPDDYDLPGYFAQLGPLRYRMQRESDVSDLPDYSDQTRQRWTYYRLRAEGHNTLVLNPGKGPDQRSGGFGKITAFQSGPQGVELAADLTGVYPAAERITRSLSFERGRRLEIRDVVKLRQPGEVWWFVHTRAAVAPSADGRTLTLTQQGRTIPLRLVAPVSGRFELGPAKPLPTSPHPPKQAVNKGVTRIAVHLSKVREAVVSVRFGE